MIKMSNLKGDENSHRALSTDIGANYSEDKAIITDFKKIFLSILIFRFQWMFLL